MFGLRMMHRQVDGYGRSVFGGATYALLDRHMVTSQMQRKAG